MRVTRQRFLGAAAISGLSTVVGSTAADASWFAPATFKKRKLSDGTWAMAYLNLSIGAIVSRTRRAAGDLHLMVSTWTYTAYHMSQWVGTL